MKILLDKNKNYYKANLHTHSEMSDGRCSLEELKAEYKKHGYSVVAFTDHEHIIDNSYLTDDEFVAITSCEIAIKEFEHESTMKKLDMKVTHLNFYALDPHNAVTPCYSTVYDHFINGKSKGKFVSPEKDFKRVYSADGINEIIRTANEMGFIVSYNHPSWSLETAADYLGYDGLFAVEIYNHSCVKMGINDDEAAFDHMLRNGKRLFCTACDDCHDRSEFGSPYNDSFGGWVMINAEKLDYSEIMQSLQKGDFYASTAPEIYSLTLDEDKNTVHIETSDAAKISLITGGRRSDAVIAGAGEKINSADFELCGGDGYFRMRIEDALGRKAYTQAYFI